MKYLKKVVTDKVVSKLVTVGNSVITPAAITTPVVELSNGNVTSGVMVIDDAEFTVIDEFNVGVTNFAKYFIQAEDNSDIHSTEITLVYSASSIEKIEFALFTPTITLGSFDAQITNNKVSLLFYPDYSSTTMTVKFIKMTI